MTELERSAARLRSRIEPPWTAERARAAEARFLSRRRRRAALRRGAAVVLLLLLPLLGAEAWRRRGERPVVVNVDRPDPVDVDADADADADADEAHMGQRDRSYDSPRRMMGSQSLMGSPSASASAITSTSTKAPEVIAPRGEAPAGPRERRAAVSPPRVSGAPAVRVASWQELAQEGDYDRAFEALGRGPAPAGAAELLLAADAARLSHHPAAAVAPLGRLLDEHPGDSRAPLGAFTLGRVLLDELGQPREAAAAFARAQELAPDGPLCQDALAREVESWARAGDGVRARQLAERYLARYPDGRRLRAVRRHGGLE